MARCFRLRYIRLVVAGALVMLARSQALAADGVPASLVDYHHTVWTESDGAPGQVWSMAQSRDGFLWLGTPTGLYRFDGMTFSRHEVLPVGSTKARGVSQVVVTADDRVAVRYGAGGIDIVPVDRTEHCCHTDGIPEGEPLGDFATGPLGRLWQITQNAVYELDGAHWTKVDLQAMGLPGATVEGMVVGGDGSIFAENGGSLYRRAPGADMFVRLVQEGEVDAGVDGRVRWRKPHGAWYPLPSDLALSRDESGMDRHQASGGTLFDSNGGFWRSSNTGDVLYTPRQADVGYAYWIKHDSKSDVMDSGRLSGGFVMSFYEDREGNVWAGTKGGIDRFRPKALTPVVLPTPAVYFAVVPGLDGSMFVGTAKEGGGDDAGWHVTHDVVTRFVPKLVTTAAYRDRDGGILAGSQEGLFRLSDAGEKTAVPIPPEDTNVKVQAIGRDGAGRLWVSFRGKPVQALIDGTWHAKGDMPLPDLSPARIAIDADGSVWFGYSTNRVDHIVGNRITTFTDAQGIQLGTVTAILPGQPLLLGGDRGTAVLRGGRFEPIHSSHPDALAGVTGLIRQGDGTVWINGLAGGVRIAGDEMEAFAKDPTHVIQVRLFGPSDGMPGTAQQVRPLPTLVEGSDGVLYFAASSGLAYLNPHHLSPPREAPRVHLDTITDKEGPHAASLSMSLAPDRRDVRIAYSAPTLSFPERLTYRYRLDGAEHAWHEVGDRREATYTNLPAGEYRFEVEAANEEGHWSGHPSEMRLHVLPKFTETRWFIVVCALVGLAILELAYMFRLKLAAHSLEQRLRVQALERERIARDLHDTLLQGIQGLLLRLQAWLKDASIADARRREISDAVDLGRALLVEGRDRIMALRCPEGMSTDLQSTIRNVCEQAGVPPSIEVTSTACGKSFAVSETVMEEIAAIVAEALRNAIVHAQPSHVDIRTAYSRNGVTLEVEDNGAGIGTEILKRGGKEGHWGIAGMRERAERLRAALTIARGPTTGTLVRLRIPRARLRR